jgi:type IV pilus assembly protein PilE
MDSKTQNLGFTLIEMMMVVVIIGILASIAIPNYQSQMIKTRRNDARIGLVETAQKFERCFAQFGSYNHAGCTVTAPTLDHYTVSVITRTATAYSLSAVVVAGGPQAADTNCAKLTYDNTGLQSAKNSDDEDSAINCWR